TWWEALRYCRENHVDLVSVHTEGIQRWVETVARNASTDNVWVGLRHTCAQGWIWSDGSNSSYEDWSPGEPNMPVGDNCAHLWNGYKWGDVKTRHVKSRQNKANVKTRQFKKRQAKVKTS
ncbi:macrophage mannose receptor 1-like, partial [Astyanax mexicanus]